MKGVIKMVVEYDMADALKTFLRMRPDYFEITIAPKRDGADINPDPKTVVIDNEEAIELLMKLTRPLDRKENKNES